MDKVVVTSEQIERERAKLSEAVAQAGAVLASAEAALADAKRRLSDFDSAVDVIGRLAGGQRVGGATYAGVSGARAVGSFVASHRGQIVELGDVVDEILHGGYEGTENALRVAVSQMVKGDQIERLSRGRYRLSAPYREAGTGEPGRWVDVPHLP